YRNREYGRQRRQTENAPHTKNEFLDVGEVQREREANQRSSEQDAGRLRLLAIESREGQQRNVAQDSDERDGNSGNGGLLASVHDIAVKGLSEVTVGRSRFAKMMIERYG